MSTWTVFQPRLSIGWLLWASKLLFVATLASRFLSIYKWLSSVALAQPQPEQQYRGWAQWLYKVFDKKAHFLGNLGKNEINRVNKTKYLGVTVDDKLNWGDQFRSVKGKIASGLASLKKLKNIISQSQLMEVYYALVENHLRYTNVVWGSLFDTKMEALQRLQNRAFDLIDSSKT